MSNPVSATAFYCAGTRMLDAERPDSLLHDTYAAAFMGDDGKATFEKFRHLGIPIGAHQVRCHLIDQIAIGRIRRDPEILIVLVGAGFDSRAFRLPGGRWVEVDEPPVIDRKEQVAPAASCPNPLQRIAVRFGEQRLADVVAPLATEAPTLVICEGVTMYLERPQLFEMAQALQASFPNHWFCADLMSRAFGRTFTKGMSRVLASIGTAFSSLEPDPIGYFISQNYRVEATVPLFAAAVAMRRLPLPTPVGLLLSALPVVRKGYNVATLRFGSPERVR
jgi:methyltransferase (TIGR00027 family)